MDWEWDGTDDEDKEDRVISLVELPDVVNTKGLVDNKGLGKSKDKVSMKGVGKVNSKVVMTDETDYMGENPWKVVVKRRVCRPPMPPGLRKINCINRIGKDMEVNQLARGWERIRVQVDSGPSTRLPRRRSREPSAWRRRCPRVG